VQALQGLQDSGLLALAAVADHFCVPADRIQLCRELALELLDIEGDAFHPEWNYTIKLRINSEP
jgi:hypothetical protein